ncbi:MAG: long-chain fatty acid--CoA ligase, partial [Pseudomonadota bacterium]
VYKMMGDHVDQVNRDLASEERVAGAQIHRFLVLHKELDADDGEMTRTRKVRRGVISDKFEDLLGALYDGSKEIYTTTEVTYEDGRKGSISATLAVVLATIVSPSEQKVAAE